MLIDKLEKGRDIALDTVRWVAGFDFPDVERDYEFVSLSHPDEYPFNEGRIVSNKGLDIEAHRLSLIISKKSTCRNRRRCTAGSRSAVSISAARWRATASTSKNCLRSRRTVAKRSASGPTCRNPYKSIIVRSVELVFAFDEALRIIRDYAEPEAPAVPTDPTRRSGIGHAATEAPRGMLYHRYQLAEDGRSSRRSSFRRPHRTRRPSRRISPPSFPQWLNMNDDDLRWRCEQTVRNYDPCISCATHFLKLEIDRD